MSALIAISATIQPVDDGGLPIPIVIIAAIVIVGIAVVLAVTRGRRGK